MEKERPLKNKWFLPTRTYQINVAYYLPEGVTTVDVKRDYAKFSFDNEKDWRKKQVELSDEKRVEWFTSIEIKTVTSIFTRKE